MAVHTECNAWYVDAYRIVLSLLSCVILVGCATTDNQTTIEQAVEISADSGSVVPQSLGNIVVRYDPNMAWKGRVASIDEFFSETIQSQMTKSRIFGIDRASPFTLTATVEWVGQTFSWSGNSGNIKSLRVRYALSKGDGQLVYRRKFSSEISDPDDQQIITKNVEQLVSDLSLKLADLQPQQQLTIAKSVAPIVRPKRSNTAVLNIPPVKLKSYSPGNVDFGKYYALIIGNNRYQHLKELKSASIDAQALDTILRNDYGFKTSLLIDATRNDILTELSILRRQLQEQDNLLIYYAGHGWIDEQADEGFWLPVDAVSDNPVNWISNSSVISTIRAIQAKHVLVVADSCFSGKLTRGLKPRIRSQDYLLRMVSRSARTALTSGGLEPVLDGGGQDGHSVFAGAFFNALSENDGVIDMAQLSNRIRRQVALAADQLPEYGDIRRAGHNGGDFLFVRKSPTEGID